MKHFTTNGREWVAVKVPSDANTFTQTHNGKNRVLHYLSNQSWEKLVLPKGNYQIFGLLSEIEKDEVKCREIIQRLPSVMSHTKLDYKDYTKDYHIAKSQYTCRTAIESLQSLKDKLKMWTENPYGEKFISVGTDIVGDYHYQKILKQQWQEAQQHVGEWLIVEKIK